MSYIRLTISDKSGSISGEMHGSMTEALIATLTAEPETIEEFKCAFSRYVETESDWGPFHCFKPYEDLETYDAGIVAIDLASRTVGYESTYSYPVSEGSVKVPPRFADDADEEIYIRYRVPDDWMFVRSIPLYEGTSSRRRDERAKNFPFDARPILYGRPLTTFIAQAIAEAVDLNAADLLSDIHAKWLTTARPELRGKTPREILLEKQRFISADLDTRAHQWSITKVCPVPLARESFAYETAGFGVNEAVVYYYMIRHLLVECANLRETHGQFEVEEEILRLKDLRDKWLHSRDADFSHRTPRDIIEHERRRLNMRVSAQEALIDENCPCCVDLSQDFETPMFWFLDGCNMDERFEFSFHKTREEYDAEQREWEEHSRRWNEDYERKKAAGLFDEDAEAPF